MVCELIAIKHIYQENCGTPTFLFYILQKSTQTEFYILQKHITIHRLNSSVKYC